MTLATFLTGLVVGFILGAMLVAVAINDYRKAALFCYRRLTDYDDVCHAVVRFPWLDDGYHEVLKKEQHSDP